MVTDFQSSKNRPPHTTATHFFFYEFTARGTLNLARIVKSSRL